MTVVAHAAFWLEAGLLAPPAGVVIVSIVRTLRGRRTPVSRSREETVR